QQFGLTAAFDGDLADRQIQFRVPGLDFETAMRVLGEQTGTFWRAVDSRTFYVAADTPEKRRDYDPEVKKTLVLGASETNDEMTETTRMVREIVGVRRSDLDVKSHTLTVRDTQENVALAAALVQEVEQSRGEALLDIDILEVDSTLARKMGITPPTTAQAFTFSAAQLQQLEQAPNVATLDQILQTIFSGQNPLAASSGSASVIPPVIAVGGGKSLFLATLPGVSGNLSQALSLVRHAQRVLLRVQDGRPASFFVGQHFPITLALLSESLIAPATQFTNAVPAGSFPRTDYTVGASPSSVTVGSFNGDASLDLAVANHGANTVSILLGNGDGTFGAHTDFATGAGPTAVVAADFNKDGKQDLAVANQTDNTVSILLGKGDGTFAAHTDIPVGTGPVAIVTADFDKDGNPDLAVLNQTTNNVSILLGKGDGTFKPRQDYAVGTTPSAMTFGDFNNDGNIDLAVTNHAANTLSMLLGKGDGTFSTRTDFETSTGPSSIASADFNGDGRLDLAVTNQTVNTLSIFLGNGDGTFSTRTDYATGNDPVAVLGADFNVDGRPDLVVANETDDTVSIFLGLGDGTLLTPFPLSTGNGPVALAQGALTSSEAATATLPDLVIANQSSDNISVILNSSNISVTPNAPLTSYPGSEYVDIGLKVHATPRLHPNSEITLDLQFDISAISGQNVNGIPILTNRTIDQSVRLRDDQTSVLSGIFQRNEALSVGGWPGLAELGPAGYLFGPHSKQASETELIIAITPRQLRLASRTDNTIYAGRGQGSAPAAPPAVIAPFPAGPVPGTPVPGAPPPGAPAPGAPVLVPPGAPQPGPGATPAIPAPGAPATPTQPAPAPPGPATQPAPTTPGPTN
ncbi:MAG TPA: FG-GAP-like repeat-containing protein, partial [Candidatus Acidoferrales bacterium]